jgi:hypothetical protein
MEISMLILSNIGRKLKIYNTNTDAITDTKIKKE